MLIFPRAVSNYWHSFAFSQLKICIFPPLCNASLEGWWSESCGIRQEEGVFCSRGVNACWWINTDIAYGSLEACFWFMPHTPILLSSIVNIPIEKGLKIFPFVLAPLPICMQSEVMGSPCWTIIFIVRQNWSQAKDEGSCWPQGLSLNESSETIPDRQGIGIKALWSWAPFSSHQVLFFRISISHQTAVWCVL